MCKMKPSCDEATAYPLTKQFMTHLWFTLLELTSQNVRHYLATIGINQPICVCYFLVAIPICDLLLLTCDTRVMYL